MKIAISADTAIDLQQNLLEKFDIKTVPFTVNMGGKTYFDGELDVNKMFEYCDKEKELPKTSAVNYEQFKEYFANLKKDYDAVIHFDISSKMSSAYQNAVNASKEFENVYCIDSETLSTGIALLAIYARNLADKGESPENIVKLVEERKKHVQASFVLDRMDYLKMGGRCSSIVALGAKLLSIKPSIIVKNGSMSVNKKYIGRNMDIIVSKYCKDTLEEFSKADKSVVFLTHSQANKSMIDVAKKILKEQGFENIYETKAGATISCHCGKNTLGILYING